MLFDLLQRLALGFRQAQEHENQRANVDGGEDEERRVADGIDCNRECERYRCVEQPLHRYRCAGQQAAHLHGEQF